MVKPTKFLRKQADRAERAALSASDPEVTAGLRALASAYRAQADIIKSKKKKTRKKGVDVTLAHFPTWGRVASKNSYPARLRSGRGFSFRSRNLHRTTGLFL
jgi:hypothetical protein